MCKVKFVIVNFKRFTNLFSKEHVKASEDKSNFTELEDDIARVLRMFPPERSLEEERLYRLHVSGEATHYDHFKLIGMVLAKFIISLALRTDLSARDQEMLDAWLSEDEENEEWFWELIGTKKLANDLEVMRHIQSRVPERWEILENRISAAKRKTYLRKISIAASLVILIAGGITLGCYLTRSKAIAPGQHLLYGQGSKAIEVDFRDGYSLDLSTLKDGQIVSHGGYALEKMDSTHFQWLAYNSNDEGSSVAMRTGAGRTGLFSFTDGTKMTLNDSSTAEFSGYNMVREVKLTGEAYFNVAHSAIIPFKVYAKGQIVHVLGTKFDVKTYSDEPTSTRLLEGSIKVCDEQNRKYVLLTPGMQITGNRIELSSVVKSDTTDLNWVNGRFAFHDLYGAMKEIGRCYGVKVMYSGKVPNISIIGNPMKNSSLSAILTTITNLGLKLKLVEGRTIIIEA